MPFSINEVVRLTLPSRIASVLLRKFTQHRSETWTKTRKNSHDQRASCPQRWTAGIDLRFFFRLNHNTSCFFSHVYIPRNKQQKKRNEHINLLKLGSSSQVSDTIYTLAWFNWINNQSWSFILSLHFPSQRCAIYCFVGPTLPHVGGVCCCCVEPIGQASPLCCPPREVWGSSLSEPGAPAFKSFVAFHANWIVFTRFFSHHTKREIEWIMVDFMGGDRKGLRILRSAKVSKTIVFLEVTGPKLYNLH